MTDERRLLLGRIVGVFGLRGELKLESSTEPRDAIFRYQPWTLRAGTAEREVSGVRGRDTGRNVVARFPGVDDRDAAEALIGHEIWVPRSALPAAAPDEYYWVDLEGIEVATVDGIALGRISHLFATGANDVIVVRGDRERLIPFVRDQVVREVDLAAGRMVVDWDPEF
ncbi:ribosome maturation factor RimM [Coralloluteibacterium stylophorae]|uniref:Ribosome maturation factor RimM n=1 Tax=Coralloluteibacterium stylophorae TaxID=1776034 RepID=A0A8J7VSW9_9GAMM|nr:ribosome maturation factor RimM [Coralloluteibacterium stylophorae]MBS7458872.1 ribosome maturation factor RimM [Coralloluteibacterium stylophorae]